jgi:hypothetical protein
LKRTKVEGNGNQRVAFFSTDVKTSLKDSTVVQGNYVLRKKNKVVFPLAWKEDKMLAVYSQDQIWKEVELPDSWNDVEIVSVFKITEKGNILLKNVRNKLIRSK